MEKIDYKTGSISNQFTNPFLSAGRRRWYGVAVIQTYEEGFHRTEKELENKYAGHDEGEFVYLEYRGTRGVHQTYYDIFFNVSIEFLSQ